MKKIKSISMVVAGMLVMSISLQTLAQKDLGPIIIAGANYKYLNAVSPEEAAQPVMMLEQYAAAYDIKGAEFYEDVYDTYFVSFYIPEGKILATYDKDGHLLKTAERFKNTAIPKNISEAVARRYPKWAIAKDVYVVRYYSEVGAQASETRKIYKLLLENGNKRMRVKLDDIGGFL